MLASLLGLGVMVGLVSFVAQLGPPDVMDIAAARANTEALLGSFNDSVDTSGIEVVDREIAGPDGSQVPVQPSLENRI